MLTVKCSKFSNSRADNSDCSGPISSIIELIRDLMVMYILTKFGADWLIFVDARVLTRKLWMDGHHTDGHRRTVSDHNSSQSTLCSGELKNTGTGRKTFNCSIWKCITINRLSTLITGQIQVITKGRYTFFNPFPNDIFQTVPN